VEEECFPIEHIIRDVEENGKQKSKKQKNLLE
jgi:hypothetical protein